MKHPTLFALASALMFSGQIAMSQATTVKRPDGTAISVIVDLPTGADRVPAVVMAPGQGYHMDLPAMASTARALTDQGFAVFRFNWAYFSATPKGQPSADLSTEQQDFLAALAAARAHARVDPQRISVAGKSLGSLVAWRVFRADPKLQSAILLTPVCSRLRPGDTPPTPEGRENYPELAMEQRPSLWISGDADPLCAPQVLYDFARTGRKTPRVAIVGGDHGYEDRSLAATEAADFRTNSLRAVSALTTAFVAEQRRPNP